MFSKGDDDLAVPLSALAPSVTSADLELTLDDGWYPMNPTIAPSGDGFRLIVRTVNWINEGGHYTVIDPDGVFRTRNFLLDADRDLNVTATREIFPAVPPGPPTFPSHVVGVEDLRLIELDGQWFGTGSVRDRSKDRATQMALVTLDEAHVERLITLASPRPGQHEKNWMPFVYDGALHFVYTCSPTVVLRCDPESGSMVTMSSEAGPDDGGGLRLRGGSQGVEVEDGWIFVVHEIAPFGGGPSYVHRFVHLDRSFVISGVSQAFFFEVQSIEFCAGLARKGDDLIISYGVADRRAQMMTVSLADVRSLLLPTGLKPLSPFAVHENGVDPSTFFDLLELAAEPEKIDSVPKTFGRPTAGPEQPHKQLTIAMATYDDYDGVYFTIQSLRLFHPEILDRISILVLDNNPGGVAAPALKSLEANCPEMRYVPCGEIRGTAVRDLLFKYSNSDWVMVLDSHVLIPTGEIAQLLDYLDANPMSDDLLQGPALWDALDGTVATHFEPGWQAGMYGSWAVDERGTDPTSDPFEIPMQGLGLFVARRESWLGFNPRFSGFGGEEGYIHQKYRNAGRRTLCLPFLRWVHRFDRPSGTKYVNRWEDRIANYILGWREVGMNESEMLGHFREFVGEEVTNKVVDRIKRDEKGSFSSFDAIFCINLDDRTERWDHIERQASMLGILDRLQRISAVVTEHNHHVGCALSHRRAIELAKLQGLSNVLVLEDDASFLYDTHKFLPKSMKELENAEWDLLFLGGHRWDTRSGPTAPFEYLEVPKAITTTHAIAYNSSIFNELLAELPDSVEEMHLWQEQNGAIDQHLQRLIGIRKVFVTSPAVATQESIIDQEDPLFIDRYMP